MPDERSAAQLSPEATYRAIGRYVYEFSQLVAHMRDAMTRHLDRSNGGVAAIAFAEAQPLQIANAFFTMCRTVTHLDPDEEKTGARVGARVGEAIEMRENVAAGDWWVGASSLGAEAVKRSAADLDHRSESLAALTGLVAEYGALCLHLAPYDRGEHRVGDYLVMRAGEAVREGPKALSAMHVFYTPALPAEVGEASLPLAELRQPVVEAQVEAAVAPPAPPPPAAPAPQSAPEPPGEPAPPPAQPPRRTFRVRLRAAFASLRRVSPALERGRDDPPLRAPGSNARQPAWLTHERLRRGMLLLAASSATLLTLGAYAGHVFGSLENNTIDTRFALRGTQKPPSDIVIVAIDTPTTATLPRWPFARRYEANVINAVRRGGAKLIGVDIQFTSATDVRDDDALINAVRRARGTVLATSAVGTHAYTNVFGETAPALLRAFGAYTGNAYVNPDSAAVLRTVVHSQNGLPSFGVILAERQLGHEISTKGYPAVVDYAGPPGTFDNVSFADVCSGLKGCTGNIKPSFFRGKTVLIGATAAVLQDLHASPVGANMSGVEYWANALWSILRGNPLRGAAGAINVLAIVLMTLVVPLLVLWLRPGLVLVGFAIAIGAVYLVIAQLEFDSNTLLPVVYPLLGLTLGTVEATAADLWAERLRRRHLEAYKIAYEALPSTEGAAFFVSYRREQSSWPARILRDELARRFGADQVFKDSDSIEAGQAWPEQLRAAISEASVVLVVIGPQWADARDRDGALRLNDPADWVRLEVEAALASADAQLVPVLVDGAAMPAATALPQSLRALGEHQAFALSVERWSSDLEALIESIHSGRIRDFLRKQRASAAGAPPTPSASEL